MKYIVPISSGLALVAALAAAPAAAQDEGNRFEGPYISVFGSNNSVDSGTSDGFAFDVDGDGEFDDPVLTTGGADAFSPGFCSGDPAGSRTPACFGNDDEWGYGVRVGYDVQLGNGPFVAGVLLEGERQQLTEVVTGYSTTPASYSVIRELDWSVAARARLGIAPGGDGLFYATGGVGYAKIDRSFITTNGANSFTPNDPNDWVFGWQAGGGAELMLTDNLGLGLEYLYSNYNDDEYVVNVGQGTAGATNPFLLGAGETNLRLANPDFDTHSFRATLNLRF